MINDAVKKRFAVIFTARTIVNDLELINGDSERFLSVIFAAREAFSESEANHLDDLEAER